MHTALSRKHVSMEQRNGVKGGALHGAPHHHLDGTVNLENIPQGGWMASEGVHDS